MIIGTGIDIIEVERITRSVERDTGFRQLVFSAGEIAYCEGKAFPHQHFAARFAAKEAFLKAVGMGLDSGLQLCEIEVVHEDGGRPVLQITGQTKTKIESLGIQRIHVSLSHLQTMATAVVILES